VPFVDAAGEKLIEAVAKPRREAMDTVQILPTQQSSVWMVFLLYFGYVAIFFTRRQSTASINCGLARAQKRQSSGMRFRRCPDAFFWCSPLAYWAGGALLPSTPRNPAHCGFGLYPS